MLSRQLPGYGLVPYSPWLGLFPPLIMTLRDRRADLVHAPVDYAALCAVDGQPLVSTFHGFVFDALARARASPLQALHYATDLRWFVGVALRRSACVTAVSNHLAAQIRAEFRYAGAVRVIPNGVDTDQFTPAAARGVRRRPLRILFPGNLTRTKGADLIPAILDRLKGEFEFAYTGGLGRGGIAIRHPRARLLGVSGHAGMAEIYRNSDVLLAPSRREGFGLAIAEAMASGLPVVASDCGGIPELVENGRGGSLCPVNDVQAFAAALQALMDNRARGRDMGDFNRQRVERHFTLADMVRRYRELFAEVLAGTARAGAC
jgi:glycosyltransferase involved in cell wall biosynthesis